LLCGGSQELRVELPHHASLIGVEICRERERERERKREIERGERDASLGTEHSVAATGQLCKMAYTLACH
jgi:hypothetical protein